MNERPELAETQADADGKARDSAPVGSSLERGAQIGRYFVVSLLGMGGMGAVYTAYDPELDRKVALKVMRASEDGSQATEGRARMLREAQGIARLQHPNVVAVHDVGPCLTHQVFIAMELVDGATLTAWLKQRDRTLAEILDVFAQAARGLAAAHLAGLVHRDFKPDNVLIGTDGRARVADFGLVREAAEPAETANPTPAPDPMTTSMLSRKLTEVGSIMGTPFYMAPEQRTRGAADARSDQYSFCVSLDQATRELRGVPPHIRAAINRGKSEDPAARWPSMDQLRAELERDPFARRRRALIAASGVAALASVAVIASYASRSPTSDPCAGAAERLGDAWNAAKRANVEHAFAATKLPYAAAAAAGVTHVLDDYAASWTRSYEDSCRATNVRHEQSAELLDLRMACFAERRADLAALADLFASADGSLVAHAVSAAGGLRLVSACNRVTIQSEVAGPQDPVQQAAIRDLYAQTSKLYALWLAGRLVEARKLGEPLQLRARELAFPELQAKVGLELGEIELFMGDSAAASVTLREGLMPAIASHADDAVAMIAMTLEAAAVAALDFSRAQEWGAFADATVKRLGNPPDLRAAAANTHGFTLSAAGKRAEAVAQFELARDLYTKIDPNRLETAQANANLAHVYDEIGRYRDARTAGERALAIETQLLGPDHPDSTDVVNVLGNIASDEGDLDAARGYYERVLAVREREVAAGAPPDQLAAIVHNLGDLAFQQERYDDALAQFTRSLALHEQVDREDPENTLPINGIANVHYHRHEYKQALANFQRSLELAERKLGKTHPYVGDALVGVGACERELGDLAGSQAALERSLAIRKTDSRPVELAEAQFELAKTVAKRGHPAQARELADTARAAYASQKGSEHEVAEIDAWLADVRR